MNPVRGNVRVNNAGFQIAGMRKQKQINLSVDLFRYLKDHRFQGMVVLPGAVYVEMVLASVAESFRAGPSVLTEIEFQKALFLPQIGTQAVQVVFSPGEHGETCFQVYSCMGGEELSDESQTLHMSGKIPHESDHSFLGILEQIGLAEIRTRCTEEVSGEDLYRQLWENGNQYGPAFQGITRLWRNKKEALGELRVPETLEPEFELYQIHPAILDACVHVLSTIRDSNRSAFLLARFEQVRVYRRPGLRHWVYAFLQPEVKQNTDTLEGHVRLIDEAGHVVMELLGTRLQYLEDDTLSATSENLAKKTIAITATFTTEPIEDSLAFWMRELDIPFKIEFAPYNQVFQQLLDPSSLLSKNQHGVNVLLVRFEDWLRSDNRLVLKVDSSERERLLTDHSCYELSNHIKIAHLNQYETEYMYQEIFVDQVYLKHGVTLRDGDCIFDVGANIGLFTLFVQQQCMNAVVYAVEPSPPVFEILCTNATLYGSNVKVFNCGLSDGSKEAPFTFYKRYSVFSGYHADAEKDEKAIKAIIQNILQENSSAETGALDHFANDLMEGRLENKTFLSQLRTISSIIREYHVERIDLLKVDAEKSELAVLKGIEEKDWNIIKQIVVEVHDNEGEVIREVMSLLKEKGFDLVLDEEDLLQRSGLYNIYATRPAKKSKILKKKSLTPELYAESVLSEAKGIERNVVDLMIALKSAVGRSQSPYLVCICPAFPTAVANSDHVALYNQMEKRMDSELAGVSGLYLVKTSELTTVYPVSTYYDPYTDKLGHIPFTSAFFTALGTMIARKIYAIQSTPYKVIVLDCDQTLWKGICGEDGALGIEIDPPRKALQESMVVQHNAGMLLCLCSKNNEEDVVEVFEHRLEMPLSRNHILSWRINWRPKSENIRSLAQELQLGLDSFIFIDDDPVECAEVRANCPEVLTLQLPKEPENIPRFLEHIWAFDHLEMTEEDKKRTAYYQQDIQREHLRKESLSFEDFLSGLDLEVQISQMASHQLSRVSQLTYRTNQFNLTTIRHSEAEIHKLCRSDKWECLVVEVRDRFGDYGLVGVIFFEAGFETIHVDTFLLSCRVLGRGVEHRMLARLGEIAKERGLRYVAVPLIPTKKNQPAFDFLDSVGTKFKEPTNGLTSQLANGEPLFKFPADYAAMLTFHPGAVEAKHTGNLTEKKFASATGAEESFDSGIRAKSELLSRIATELYNADQILDIVELQKRQQRSNLTGTYVAPNNELERIMASIWQKVLGVDRVGIHDNFFEIGGTSLKGIQFIAQLEKELSKRGLNVEISPSSLSERTTISAIAKMLSSE